MPQPRDDQGRFTSRFGAILVVGVLGTATATGAGAEGFAGGAGTAARADTPSLSIQSRSARGRNRSGRTQRRLVTRGLRERLRAERDSESCAADAYGQVREFLLTHSCESVYRALLEVRKGDVAALVAVAWVDMGSQGDATDLRNLVDRPGTGNITQLPPPGRGEAVDVQDAAYASRQRGTTVTIAEAEPEAVTASQRVLNEIAQETADDADAAG